MNPLNMPTMPAEPKSPVAFLPDVSRNSTPSSVRSKGLQRNLRAAFGTPHLLFNLSTLISLWASCPRPLILQ
jgi:hypothetical protein